MRVGFDVLWVGVMCASHVPCDNRRVSITHLFDFVLIACNVCFDDGFDGTSWMFFELQLSIIWRIVVCIELGPAVE